MKLPTLPCKEIMKGRQANADEIRTFINKHGLSVQEFADRIEVTHQSVHYWLSGDRFPSACTTKFIRLLDKYPQLIREL